MGAIGPRNTEAELRQQLASDMKGSVISSADRGSPFWFRSCRREAPSQRQEIGASHDITPFADRTDGRVWTDSKRTALPTIGVA